MKAETRRTWRAELPENTPPFKFVTLHFSYQCAVLCLYENAPHHPTQPYDPAGIGPMIQLAWVAPNALLSSQSPCRRAALRPRWPCRTRASSQRPAAGATQVPRPPGCWREAPAVPLPLCAPLHPAPKARAKPLLQLLPLPLPLCPHSAAEAGAMPPPCCPAQAAGP